MRFFELVCGFLHCALMVNVVPQNSMIFDCVHLLYACVNNCCSVIPHVNTADGGVS